MSQGWIVEVDAEHRVRLQGFDFLSGTRQCCYVIAPPFDKAHFTLTEAKQKARSRPPFFSEDAALQLQQTEDGWVVTVPAAESADDYPVFLYRAELLDEAGKALESGYVLHEYWFASEKKTYSIALPRKSGVRSVRVWAENAYGMASAPLTKEVS